MPISETHVKLEASSSAHRQNIRTWWRRLALILLCLAGLGLRLAHLAAKPFWFDECFSAEVVRLSWGSFLRVLWWREANMALYYVLLRLWMQFSQSVFFIRSLSVFIATATIAAIYWLAKRLFDRRVAWIAAILFTFNAYNVRYAQEARGYALFTLLATLSSGFLVAWLREAKGGSRAGYVAATTLAAYTHFYAVLLPMAQWLVLVSAGYPASKQDSASTDRASQIRRAWKMIAFAVLPLLAFVAKTGAGPIRWIHRPQLHDLLSFWQQFSGGKNWILPLSYLAACIAALLPVRKHVLQRNQSWGIWCYQFLLIWFLFPVVLTMVLSFFRPLFLPRFLIFCQPALIILAAAGISRLRPAWLIAPLLSGLLLLALQGIFFVYSHDYDDQRDGSGAAVNLILDHTEPGDGIIFQISEARVPYEFFRSQRTGKNTASPRFSEQIGPEILYPHEGPGLEFADFKTKIIPEILRSQISQHPRVWTMFMYNETGGAYRTTRLLNQMLPEQYPQKQCWQFPSVEVCLYTKK
jgi:mannosyltransferase